MKNHLRQSQTVYLSHAVWALISGIQLIWAGITSIVHAILPGVFPGVAAKTVITLYYSILHNHPNPDYQVLIDQAKQKQVPNDAVQL